MGFEEKMYGDSKMLRYVAGTNEPIYPIGYIQTKKPMNIKTWKLPLHGGRQRKTTQRPFTGCNFADSFDENVDSRQ